MLGVGIGVSEDQLSVYISNFVRLGLMRWHSGLAGSYTNAPPELRTRVESEFPNKDTGKLSVLFMRLTPLWSPVPQGLRQQFWPARAVKNLFVHHAYARDLVLQSMPSIAAARWGPRASEGHPRPASKGHLKTGQA